MKLHFEQEEEFMTQVNYLHLKRHKLLHEDIIKIINDFVKQLPTLNEDLIEKELAKIIDITLLQHIIQEDRKVIEWVKANRS